MNDIIMMSLGLYSNVWLRVNSRSRRVNMKIWGGVPSPWIKDTCTWYSVSIYIHCKNSRAVLTLLCLSQLHNSSWHGIATVTIHVAKVHIHCYAHGLSVEASANTAVKICPINLKTSLSGRTLGKWIDGTLIHINSCAQWVESQGTTLLFMQGNMNVILWLYCVTMASHMSITEDIP